MKGEEQRFFGSAEFQEIVDINSSHENLSWKNIQDSITDSRVTTDHVYVRVNYISLQPATHFHDIP